MARRRAKPVAEAALAVMPVAETESAARKRYRQVGRSWHICASAADQDAIAAALDRAIRHGRAVEAREGQSSDRVMHSGSFSRLQIGSWDRFWIMAE